MEAENIIKDEVLGVIKHQQRLDELEAELSRNKKFQQFLKLQKEIPAQIEASWKQIESHMLEANIKSVKGEWGSITIAERLGWDIDIDQLPNKFIKRVPDTKKISDTYRLEGKEPKGCTPKTTKYLTKRIK